jgi:NADPH-dependent 2,4-dienoyl-CoA reductase/sulfur reductase-like enzyme/rhodanese-related sulfurtransferase
MERKNAPADEPPDRIDNLIRVLSHQLKSPVNAIESMLNVILEGFTGDVDSTTAHYLRKAVSKSQEARKMITDLLDYEHFSSGKEINKEPVDLIGLLSALSNNYLVAAAEKNISLSFDLAQEVTVTVNGSRSGLESAFKNLIENAIKYTGERGSVSIEAVADEKAGSCTVKIRDTGCGVPENEIGRLFEPFFRASSSKAGIGGTGLGLAIVKSVIENHGGTVTFSSVVDKGTTFVVTLPCAAARKTGPAGRSGRRVVIVGGVTAGPKTAARLRRLDETVDITIIEKTEFLSYSGCGIPSYVRGTVLSPKALMSTSDNTLRDVLFFEAIKNIRVFIRTEAIKIDRGARELHVRDLTTGVQRKIPYDVLVLATGAESVVPPITGIDAKRVYSLYNIEDAEEIKLSLARKPASDVCILGGGLVGIETAESLLVAGGRVTILEKDDRILKLFDPDISLKVRHALNSKGIQVVTGVAITGILPEDGKHRIVTSQGQFMADIIILSAGVRPNSGLAVDAGLTIGANGGIQVNERLQTSDPSVYAVGDCAESKLLVTRKYSYLPLGSISTKMGRIAADAIAGRDVTFPGSIGTTMFKIFDIQVARTGLEERSAVENGFDPVSAVVAGLDKSHYEPGVQHVVIKVLADRTTGRVLGAQGYGRGNVSKRIEVLACAVATGLTLEEVFLLDLGYYPAFNTPIDIAQTACLVLKNKIDGLLETMELEEFERVRAQNTVRIVDVSPLQEHPFNTIPGSINVPLENLRQEGLPFDKNEQVVLYSKTSSRAYEAYRYLHSGGRGNMSVLEGGYVFWKK